ncbi:MAG: hypothetical protein GX284_07745 [Clostridiales bacterium]|mgnify:FL=1|nr:hypothetical protein [Clostridiales bacterium]
MSEQENMKEQDFDRVGIDELTEKEAEEVRKILERFLKAYQESGEEQETYEWLEKQLKAELPEKTEKEIKQLKDKIISSIEEYNADLEDLNEKMRQGETKEKWFADKLEESVKGVSVNNYGNYLQQINNTLEAANDLMIDTVMTNSCEISKCINLDGFIAEQYHVNTFNARAALEKSDFRAKVLRPLPGENFRKNSFDVVIENTKTGERVHQYQLKFGKNIQETKQLLNHGNYNNQRYLVPAEQAQELQREFPTKTVTDQLGGTDKVKVESDPLTKEQVKKMQLETQEGGGYQEIDWNIYNTRELALHLGKQAAVSGMQSALVCTGIELAGKAINGEMIEGGEVLETALKTGTDAGVKAAAGGALTVASERGIIAFPPKGTAPGMIAKIACVGVENIKIMWKVAKGELTISEGLEQMGRTSVAMYAGLSAGAVGAGIGAAALGWIPIAGPILGGLVGGMVGYAAGSKFGTAVFNGAKKVVSVGKKMLQKTWEGVKNVGRKITDKLFGWL